jgi:ubiquinone biosynthesis accessory factor UbiJ
MQLTQPTIVVLNHLLKHEIWAREQLRPHVGKVVQCKLLPLGFEAVFAIDIDGLVCQPRVRTKPQTIALMLEIPLTRLWSQGSATDAALRIEGDLALATALSKVVRVLRWEAAEDLARLIGVLPAQILTRSLQHLLIQAVRWVDTSLENCVEYLQYEQAVLVDPQTQDSFSQQVTALENDLVNLELRVARLRTLRARSSRRHL